MNDKKIYIAIVVDKGDWGQQLLRYAFEYPITEYWAEPSEQAKMKDYFKANHYSQAEPLQIEESEILDYLPYANPHTPPQEPRHES